MLRVFRELISKQNGGTCIQEAVPAYVLWTNACLKWLYLDNVDWKRIAPHDLFDSPAVQKLCKNITIQLAGENLSRD